MIVSFCSLGCKVNHYETEAMRERFLAAHWQVVPFPEKADVYVINTCTVTAASDAKSRNCIFRAQRANPEALVAVTGCYAQLSPERVLAIPGVSLALGTDRRAEIVELVTARLNDGPGSAVTDSKAHRAFESLSAVRDGRTRATLKIQDGCNNYCSYCIIPYARGPIRSRPMESVQKELSALGAAGYREVVLTGIHLASYGKDLPNRPGLLDVLRLVEEVPGVSRVRLGSLEPGFVTESFAAEAAKLSCLCRQFHLSLQSGSDTVLARMRRQYDTAAYEKSAAFLRCAMPDAALTTDLIAGFPGETEAEHMESLAFVSKMGFSRIHVFPYSVRQGTAAASLPGQLEKGVKRERAKALIALGKTLENRFLSGLVGRELEVLAETGGAGYSREYAKVKTEAPEGEIVYIRAERVLNNTIIGKEIQR